MNFLRRIFGRSARRAGTRFQRYYGGVAHKGVGYPTADEARRDLSAYDRTSMPFGWPH